MPRRVIKYYARGLVERVRRGRRGKVTRCAGNPWRPGYSEQGDHGPMYPWMTRRECMQDAAARNAKAVFLEMEKGL